MNLHDKRFRSKASSASHLSPHGLGFSNTVRYIFLRNHNYDTVSKGRVKEADFQDLIDSTQNKVFSKAKYVMNPIYFQIHPL